MHLYAEKVVRVRIWGDQFAIVIENQKTKATITVSGPVAGVLEDPLKVMDETEVRQLGEEIALLLGKGL